MRNAYRAGKTEKKPRKISRFWSFVLLCLILQPSAFTAFAYGAITQSLGYQGFLVSKSANLAADSPQDLKFVLYDAPLAGNALFTESRCNVPVLKGRYDVEIGSTAAGGIPPSVFQNVTQVWLEVQIDPDGDCSGTYESLLPRITMQAAPYAFNSLYASTAGAAAAVFLADTIGSLPATANGAITVSTNLFVQGGVSVGTLADGRNLSVAGIIESAGPGGGFLFPDGSMQTKAAAVTMWDQYANDLFSINPGNVGISTGAPQARLHIYDDPGEAGNILLISTGSSDIFRVTGEGKVYGSVFYGSAAGLSGVLRTTGDTMTGQLTLAGSSLTVGSPLGLTASRMSLAPNIEISTAMAAAAGGVYISTHVFIPAGAKYYGDGSGLTNLVNASDPARVAKAGDSMTGQLSILGSSLTVINTNPANAYSLAVTNDPSMLVYHLYVSTQGNTGIGTSAPANKLSVAGDILAASDITTQGVLYAPLVSAGNIIASSGTFNASGGYSIETASGILVNSGMLVAPYFAGDGSLLTGETGADLQRVRKAGDLMTGNLTITGSSLTVVAYGADPYVFTVSTALVTDIYSLGVTDIGNVGVQMPGPSSPLDVNGRIEISQPIGSEGQLSGTSSLFINPYGDAGYIHWADGSLIATPGSNVNNGVLGFLPYAGYREFVYRASGSDPGNGGQEVFRIKSDKDGNWWFGIGTIAPAEKLHINVNTLFGPSLASPIMYVSTTSLGVGISTSAVTHRLTVDGGILATSSITARGGYYGDPDGVLTLVSTTAVYVNGNLGVGTTEPGAKLDIRETGAEMYTMAVGLSSAETYDMVITTVGNVGIGVSNPGAALQLGGSLKLGANYDTGDATILLDPSGGALGGNSTIIFREAGLPPKAVMGTKVYEKDFIFRINSDVIGSGGTEVYRVFNTGYIWLETPVVAQSSFTVAGEASFGGTAGFGGASTRSTFTAEGFWQPRWLATAQIQALSPTAVGQVVGNSEIYDLCVSTGTAPGEWALAGSKGAQSCW